MIAIIGVNDDDILYFRTKMKAPEKVKLTGEIFAYVGTLAREDTVVCATGEGDYLSCLATSLLLDKFNPYLVFNVGTVSSFSSQLKQGDLFIPERYYFAGVDFFEKHKSQYGEIPGMPPYFVADSGLNATIEKTAYAITNRFIQRGFLLSGECFYTEEGPLESIRRDHYAQDEQLVAYDNSSAGVALACHLSQTALLTIKAVSYQVGNEEQKLNYIRKGLEAMPILGKILAKFIIEKEIE